MSSLLFWAALFSEVIITLVAFRYKPNEIVKSFFVYIPFFLILAAAVAKYIGE